MAGSGLWLVVEVDQQYLSDCEETLDRGEQNRPPVAGRDRGTVEDHDDHEELEEMDEDRDREVQVVESDVTDAGDEVHGVADLLGTSRIVTAGRIRDLTDGKP